MAVAQPSSPPPVPGCTPVFDAPGMRDADRRATSVHAIPSILLMERARWAAADLIAGSWPDRRAATILVGTGNNGGDGWVAARHLRRRGVDVTVRSLGYPKGDTSPRRLAAIAAIHDGVPVSPVGDPEPADLVIDALFGSGFHGTLPDVVVPWTEHPAPVLAVDLASGLDGTTGEAEGAVFRATRTVTFGALKTGHLIGVGPDVSGEVEVVDIGLGGESPEWLLCEDADAELPERPRTAHKWSAGAVGVVGASPGIAGAAVLAARSALNFGAGAVRLIVPGGVAATVAAMDPGLLTTAVGTGDRFAAADVAAVIAEPVAQPDAQGYRETQHVRDY